MKRTTPAVPSCPAVKAVCKTLQDGAKQDVHHHCYGSLVFGGLLFAAGAAAWSLPLLFISFTAVCLPWRAVDFVKQKWVFFLIDFCYFVNLATVVYLLWFPNDARVEALVYALADGPVAGALVAWQCPWLFGSAEHTVSVLMHLLPGLAMFAHRYYTPPSLRGWQGMWDSGLRLLQHKLGSDSVVQPAARPSDLVFWLVVAPLLFYILWQLFYFLVVQVLFRSFILRHGYETSYTCLARRAAKTNNVWNRLVRKGSIMRRCAMYGALQLAFTVICCLVFLTTYFCFPLAFLLQVVKFVFPIYYGSKYEKTKVPQHVFLKGMQHLDVVRQQQTAGKEEQAATMVSAPTVELCASVPMSPKGLRLRSSCAAEVAQLQPLMPRPVYA